MFGLVGHIPGTKQATKRIQSILDSYGSVTLSTNVNKVIGSLGLDSKEAKSLIESSEVNSLLPNEISTPPNEPLMTEDTTTIFKQQRSSSSSSSSSENSYKSLREQLGLAISLASPSSTSSTVVSPFNERQQVDFYANEKIDTSKTYQGFRQLTVAIEMDQDDPLTVELYMKSISTLLSSLHQLSQDQVDNLIQSINPEQREQYAISILKYSNADIDFEGKKASSTKSATLATRFEELIVTIIRYFFLSIRMAAPFIRKFLNFVIAQERKHQISSRLVKTAVRLIQTATKSEVGKLAVTQSHAIVMAILKGLLEVMSAMNDEIGKQE